MQYSEADLGRVFNIRLHDGEILHEKIESFSQEKNIKAGLVTAIGGADKGSILVVGPKNGRAEKIIPMEYILEEAHEITGTGTIYPDDLDNSVLHMHVSCGRRDKTVTGCVRKGVKVWQVMEITIIEFLNSTGKRLFDEVTGFKLLQFPKQ